MSKRELLAALKLAGITHNYDKVPDLYCELTNIISNDISKAITPLDSVILPAVIVSLDTISKFLREQEPYAANVADDLLQQFGTHVTRFTDTGAETFVDGKRTDKPFKIFEGKINID